jgi:hypothetical protein
MSKYLKEKFNELFNLSCKVDKFITAVDLFGQGINLRLHTRIKSKTILGGFLTIITVLLLTSMFYYNLEDVWYKTNPQVTVEQIVSSEYPNITLDIDSMPISVAMTNNNNYVINKPRYFKFFAKLKYGLTTNPNLEEKNINLVPCKKDYFPRISNESYDSLNMNQNLCLENQNVTIGGSWSKDYISYLALGIKLCQNITTLDNCAPFSEIKEFIKTTHYFWNVFFQNTNINPQNAENPITYNVFSVYKGINLESFKTSELYIRNQKLHSDEGLISSTNTTNSSLGYDYNTVDDGSISDEVLIEFNFLVSYNKFIYHRKYLKIQNVLANVGGLASVIRITCIVICYIFSVIKRDEKILNKIFDYDLSEINHLYGKKNLKLNSSNVNMNSNLGANSNVKMESRLHSLANSQVQLKKDEVSIGNQILTKNPYIYSNVLNQLNDKDLNTDTHEIKNLPKDDFENSLTKRKHMLLNNYLIPDKLSTSKVLKPILSNRSVKFHNSSLMKSFNSIKLNNSQKFVNLSTPIILSKNSVEKKCTKQKQEQELEFRMEKIEEAGGRKLEKNKVNQKYKINLKEENYKDNLNSEHMQITQRNEKSHVNKHVQFDIVEPDEEKQFKLKFSKPKQIINFMNHSKRRYELKFSSFDILKGFICCCLMNKNLRLKKELYNKSKFAIEQFLDITFIFSVF